LTTVVSIDTRIEPLYKGSLPAVASSVASSCVLKMIVHLFDGREGVLL
jgi:hypothetical protein